MESHSKIAILHFMNDRKYQTKNYQKKSLFWDRQHLYSQNLMLRQKIKELVDSNTKAKTKLLKSQKQMLTLTTKGRSLSSSTMILKPDSYSQRFTSMQKIPYITSKTSILKQQNSNKMLIELKQIIRHLKQEIEKLQNQNSFIKKSMKYTRIAELQTQIKEMQEENIRLHRLAIQAKQNQDESYALCCKQIDQMKVCIRKEGEQKIFYAKQLTKTKTQAKQMLNKYKQLQKNKNLAEKRFTNELQKLKKNMWSKNKNKSQLQAKLQYSATAFDKSNSPSLNFDKLNQIQSNQQIYNYLSEGVNFKSKNMEQSYKKITQKASLTSLQLLTVKNSKQDLVRISNGQPFDEQINEENYEDQFERQQQSKFNKIKGEENIISKQTLNSKAKLGKISIEEEIKEKLNQGNQSEEYQYILEEDL